MDNPLDSDDPQAAKQPAAAPAPQPSGSAQPIAEAVAKPKGAKAGKPRKKGPHPALIALGVVVGLAAIGAGVWFTVGQSLIKPAADQMQSAAAETPKGPLAPYVKGSIAHMVTLESPKAMDNMAFVDREHHPVHLADFKGQVVVLNIWATWCTPCRIEMPTLAKLQSAYASKGLKVIPLSGDGDERFDDVKSFIDVQEPLEVYADPDLITKAAKLNVQGLPATLILDKQGREVARLDGTATWDTPEVKALMDKLLSQ